MNDLEQLTLREIASYCGASGYREGSVSRISTDSRDVDENTLFIALKGERFDAHDFVPEVLSRGAAALCSREIPGAGANAKILMVADTGKAFLDIAAGYRASFSIPVIALTGSVGKTTTKGMIYSVVKRKFCTLRTEGNLNNDVGVPKTLLRLSHENTAAVIEMGMNHAGEISALTRAVRPTIGVITNIGTAHIENLGSREGILKAKCEILQGMEKGSPLVVNADNDLLGALSLPDYRLVRFGIDSPDANVKATGIESTAEGSRFWIHHAGEQAECFVPAVGLHNVYNALCAVSVGLLLGYSLKEASDAVRDFVPEGMRQNVKRVHGVTVIEDCYNANPDSMRASLMTLSAVKTTRGIAVLGDMKELGDYSEKAHREIGSFVASTGTDALFTYGEAAACLSEEAGKGGVRSRHFTDKESLTKALSGFIAPGDTLLFKGSRSMQMEDIFTALYKEWDV